MNAFVIDAFEFCRLKKHRQGEFAVSDLPRLAQESVDRSGKIDWALQGGLHESGNPQLTLSVSGAVRLVCQRCLGPFEFPIDSSALIVLAQDEASADELDEQFEDEPVEVIVGSRALNIVELIEDEALLALPFSPRHEICPDSSLLDASQAQPKESPFAVLKGLKKD